MHCKWWLWAAALCLLCGGNAIARPITAPLRKATALVAAHGSATDAKALGKLLMMEGFDDVPLHKSFVDASIGSDSLRFIDRQLTTLRSLRTRRPYLDKVIALLEKDRADLEHHGYMNFGPKVSSAPLDRLILGERPVDEARYQKHVRILAGERDVYIVDPQTQQRRRVRLDDRHIANGDNKLGETIAFLTDYYAKLGLEAKLLPFDFRGKTLYNLEVTIPGRSESTILLGAHYDTAADSRAKTPRDERNVKVAPGADDNATGTAALMEAAAALSGKRFEKTIKLVHFCGEEQPGFRRGSMNYARDAHRSGDPIEAVFIVDSIGVHGKSGPRRVVINTTRGERSLFLGSEISRVAAHQQMALKPVGNIPEDGTLITVHDTDSHFFASRGIPSVFISEDFRWRLGIHDRFDVSSKIDFDFATQIVGATTEAVARVAIPVEAPAPKLDKDDLTPGSTIGGYKDRKAGSGRDELMGDDGKVRKSYRSVSAYLDSQRKGANDHDGALMNRSSKDSWTYRAYPRVMSAQEFMHVRKGLDQIGRVMQAALKDLYSPKSKLLAAGVVTQEELAQTEDYDPSLVGRLGKADFDFLVRPDLVRGPDGRYAVLELNQGYAGGIANVSRLRQLLRQANPKLFDSTRIKPTEDFVGDFAGQLKSLAPKGSDGKVVFYTYGEIDYWNGEEERYFKNELKKRGVDYVSEYTNKKLVTIRKRVYLEAPDGTREPVAVVYARKGWQPEEMTEAHVAGNVRVFPTPGSAVMESKNLYRKLPQMIRVLLGEEPVLRYLGTRSFARKDGTLDQRTVTEVFEHPERWVIKSAIGAQGDGVLVGKDAKRGELATWKQKVLANPGGWDAQEYVEPSTLNGEHVDLDPYLVSAKGETLIPYGAMVRTARGKNKFGDDPRFLDTWVLDESPARDYLGKIAR